MKKPSKTVALLQQLASIRLSKAWTVDDLRLQLNQHLETGIPNSKSGRAQVDRWIHTARKGWVEPRSEVILSVQKVLEEHARHLL